MTCECGAQIPEHEHIFQCKCGRLWGRADCSESCEEWRILA